MLSSFHDPFSAFSLSRYKLTFPQKENDQSKLTLKVFCLASEDRAKHKVEVDADATLKETIKIIKDQLKLDADVELVLSGTLLQGDDKPISGFFENFEMDKSLIVVRNKVGSLFACIRSTCRTHFTRSRSTLGFPVSPVLLT